MLKAVGSNWIYNFANLAVQLVLTRTVVRTVGLDLNGAWENVVASTGLLTLLLLGVPLTSVRWFSQALAAKDHDRLNRAVATCFGAYAILGGVAAVLSGGFFLGFETWTIPKILESATKAGVDAEASAHAARVGYGLMTLTIAGGFMSQVPYAVLAAHRDFGTTNVVRIASLGVRLCATLLLLKKEPTALVELGVVQVLCVVFEWIASTAAVKRKYAYVRLGFGGFDRAILKEILGFSVFVLLLNLGNKLMFQTSGLVLGWFKDVTLADASVYEKAKTFVLPITEFAVSIGAVVMPTAVKLKTEGKVGELRDVYLKWSKIALGVTLVPGLYLAAFGAPFLREYLDPKGDLGFDWATAGRVQFVLLLAHFVFLPVRGVAMAILTGVGDPKRATVGFLVAGAVNLAASVVVLPLYGLDGVAWATAIPLAVFSAYLLGLVCAETGLSPRAWAAYVLPKPLVGSALVLGALWIARRVHEPTTLVELVIAGVLYVPVFAAAWIFVVHRGDPHADLWAALRARLTRSRPR